MRLVLSLLSAVVVFFTIHHPVQGVFCFLSQAILIGWIPAAIWTLYAPAPRRIDFKLNIALAAAGAAFPANTIQESQ